MAKNIKYNNKYIKQYFNYIILTERGLYEDQKTDYTSFSLRIKLQ